jgi:hypothetical protein
LGQRACERISFPCRKPPLFLRARTPNAKSDHGGIANSRELALAGTGLSSFLHASQVSIVILEAVPHSMPSERHCNPHAHACTAHDASIFTASAFRLDSGHRHSGAGAVGD